MAVFRIPKSIDISKGINSLQCAGANSAINSMHLDLYPVRVRAFGRDITKVQKDAGRSVKRFVPKDLWCPDGGFVRKG